MLEKPLAITPALMYKPVLRRAGKDISAWATVLKVAPEQTPHPHEPRSSWTNSRTRDDEGLGNNPIVN